MLVDIKKDNFQFVASGNEMARKVLNAYTRKVLDIDGVEEIIMEVDLYNQTAEVINVVSGMNQDKQDPSFRRLSRLSKALKICLCLNGIPLAGVVNIEKTNYGRIIEESKKPNIRAWKLTKPE